MAKNNRLIIGIFVVVLVLAVLYFSFGQSIFLSGDTLTVSSGSPTVFGLGLSSSGEVAGDGLFLSFSPQYTAKRVPYPGSCPFSTYGDCRYWCGRNGFHSGTLIDVTNLRSDATVCYNNEYVSISDLVVSVNGVTVLSNSSLSGDVVSSDLSGLVNQYCSFGSFDSECVVPVSVSSSSGGVVSVRVSGCSNTFSDANPSCKVTFLDRDADGFADNVDRCINEPETVNGYQDADGCPDVVPDFDSDGFIDTLDKCVKEPETVNNYQDDDGCPDELPVVSPPVVSSPVASPSPGVLDSSDTITSSTSGVPKVFIIALVSFIVFGLIAYFFIIKGKR